MKKILLNDWERLNLFNLLNLITFRLNNKGEAPKLKTAYKIRDMKKSFKFEQGDLDDFEGKNTLELKEVLSTISKEYEVALFTVEEADRFYIQEPELEFFEKLIDK
jgi:hypothetical protein